MLWGMRFLALIMLLACAGCIEDEPPHADGDAPREHVTKCRTVYYNHVAFTKCKERER